MATEQQQLAANLKKTLDGQIKIICKGNETLNKYLAATKAPAPSLYNCYGLVSNKPTSVSKKYRDNVQMLQAGTVPFKPIKLQSAAWIFLVDGKQDLCQTIPNATTIIITREANKENGEVEATVEIPNSGTLIRVKHGMDFVLSELEDYDAIGLYQYGGCKAASFMGRGRILVLQFPNKEDLFEFAHHFDVGHQKSAATLPVPSRSVSTLLRNENSLVGDAEIDTEENEAVDDEIKEIESIFKSIKEHLESKARASGSAPPAGTGGNTGNTPANIAGTSGM